MFLFFKLTLYQKEFKSLGRVFPEEVFYTNPNGSAFIELP
jgi:hypothetical protein